MAMRYPHVYVMWLSGILRYEHWLNSCEPLQLRPRGRNLRKDGWGQSTPWIPGPTWMPKVFCKLRPPSCKCISPIYLAQTCINHTIHLVITWNWSSLVNHGEPLWSASAWCLKCSCHRRCGHGIARTAAMPIFTCKKNGQSSEVSEVMWWLTW